jgi:glutamine synthetase
MSKSDNYLALANPISLLTDKDRAEFTRPDLLKVIKEKQIERITFHYTAVDGKIKELKIPIACLSHADIILAEGERCDGSSLFKGLVETGKSDLYIVPDFTTAFFNPFEEKSLDLICRFMTPDGERAAFAPDNILYKAHELLKKNSGVELHALTEMEFFLLSDPINNIYPMIKQKGYHSSAPYAKTGEILNEMLRYLTQVTGNVKYAHYEVGYYESLQSDFAEINGKRAEQLEIEFLPTPMEYAADFTVLSRWIIRNVAYKYGMVATFAPKLEEGVAGNGMHVHMALMKDGKNIMTDTKGNLSQNAKKVIGGLCTYADSLTAYGNTVSSSYLRLVPNQEAPTSVCWSDMNRSALIRVPLSWNKVNNLCMKINQQEDTPLKDKICRQTVELRSPDGSANAHLLLAGITMAVDWGLTNEESLAIADSHYVKEDIHQNKEILSRLESLPTSCAESASILLMQKNLYERGHVFPSSMINYVAKLLQAENDGNLNKRILDLAAEERLKESRRIMHKDIHRN